MALERLSVQGISQQAVSYGIKNALARFRNIQFSQAWAGHP